jgi:hypothetical protein
MKEINPEREEELMSEFERRIGFVCPFEETSKAWGEEEEEEGERERFGFTSWSW